MTSHHRRPEFANLDEHNPRVTIRHVGKLPRAYTLSSVSTRSPNRAYRTPAALGRGRWDADGLRDIVREYVVEHMTRSLSSMRPASSSRAKYPAEFRVNIQVWQAR